MLTDSDREALVLILGRSQSVLGDPFSKQLQDLVMRGLVEFVPRLTNEGRAALYPEAMFLGPIDYPARDEA